MLVGGFIVGGESLQRVIVRGLGPSLASVGIQGAIADPILELYDSTGALVSQNDNWATGPDPLPEGMSPNWPTESAIMANLLPGSYTAVLHEGASSSGVGLIEIYDLNPATSQIRNISTRSEVGMGDNVMIGGIIIGGMEPTRVIVRAVGPSLTAAGVAEALQDPILELHNGDGSLLFQNDNWRDTQEAQILASTIPPSDNRESAIVATLPPGNYTAIVRGAANSTGVALVEVYNLNVD